MTTKKPKTASQILKRYEDANEYHFHKLDRKWIEEAMAEYSAQNCDLIQELFTRPAQVLKPLEDLYRKENPDPNGRFYVPDTTKFYKWIVSKLLNNQPDNFSLEDILPICVINGGYMINLAGMENLSPTGEKWGYAPFAMTYKTMEEADEVRKEIYKTMKLWFTTDNK